MSPACLRTPSPAASAGPAGLTSPAPGTVDCLVTVRTNTPVDAMGNLLPTAGRWLILQAASVLYGLDAPQKDLTRDADRRWLWPGRGLHASVAHCGRHSAVALSASGPVGVDVQDERDRPGAMAWLGEVLGNSPGRPACIRDFAECEALIKVSTLTKETFRGIRLPPWTPSWRSAVPPYHLRSTMLSPRMHLALAAENTPVVRWWSSVDGAAPRNTP